MGQQTPLEKKKRLAKRGIMSRLASPFCGLGWGLEEGREGGFKTHPYTLLL